MKVVIEVDENGWKTSVELNNKTIVERHVATISGARGIEGDFEKETDIPEDLYDALTGFAAYNIMRALRKMKSH